MAGSSDPSSPTSPAATAVPSSPVDREFPESPASPGSSIAPKQVGPNQPETAAVSAASATSSTVEDTEEAEDAEDEEPPYFKYHISEVVFRRSNGVGGHVVIEDPFQKVTAFNRKFGSLRMPEVERRPLDRDAAVHFVEQFRKGIHGFYTVNGLLNYGFAVPNRDVLDKILAANELNWEDKRVDNHDKSDPYEGRIWEEVIIPDGLLPERKPFDRAAAKYIVKQFRQGKPAQKIMDDLKGYDYELPSWETVDVILSANGLFDDFVERAGSNIVIPDDIFDDGA
ncbi:hypothetical protein MMC30_000034 [Trapelia coarctata]|nr:hypothetical protein [Trapelia coarctata]